MYNVFRCCFFILLFSNIGFGRELNSCSDKWLHHIKRKTSSKIILDSLLLAIPVLGTIGGAILIDNHSRSARMKSKAGKLMRAAGNLYENREKKHLIDQDDLIRVKNFYDKYLNTHELNSIKFSTAVMALAKYDKIAFRLNKCKVFKGDISLILYYYSRKTIAQAIFKNGKVRKKIQNDIDNISDYEELVEKVTNERKKDLDKWSEIF